MNQQLSSFAARLCGMVANRQPAIGNRQFSQLALELFALQFNHNSAYRKICKARKLTPDIVEHWTQIPAVPAAAFKELKLTSLAPDERTAVFHSSGTTEQKSSRHFHSTESLAVYETSLWAWFERNVVTPFMARAPSSHPSPPLGEKVAEGRLRGSTMDFNLIALTPPPALVPYSSLVHMFEVVRQKLGSTESAFVGKLAADGTWILDFIAVMDALSSRPQASNPRPLLLLGTAFSFVHLLDHLVERNLSFQLPGGSRVMETGGYKNRSRTMPKTELHALITKQLGVTPGNIICEYGMSELSSQAYDSEIQNPESRIQNRVFQFPPWARVQIISPETVREVAEGETGLIRVFDLANVFSVAAIQTEDLGIRRGDGFELIGRAQLAEPRGCSLMTI
ncbi:MAG: hypothetical protein WDM80_17600 [Limisphaerales bacterium]